MKNFLCRSLTLTLVLSCLSPGVAAAEVVVPLSVGDRQVRVAVDEGYLRTSEKLPTIHAVIAAGLPLANRLVEAFVTEADAKRMMLGLPLQDTFLQVQLMRNAESLDFTADEWEQGRPQLARSLGLIDLNAVLKKAAIGSDARMSAASGVEMSTRFGELGKPALYKSEGPSLRFVMLLPVSVQVAGKSENLKLECAGAVVRLSSKLVFLFAYRRHEQDNDAAQVRAALDDFVERAIALDTDTPALSERLDGPGSPGA